MKKTILGCLPVLGLLTACEGAFNDVLEPSFDVTVSSLSYEVNQPITFDFTGNSDIVTFYSGESGSEYQYKDRTQIEGGKPQLQFTSLRRYGAQNGIPDNTITLLVSEDFTNVHNATAIENATWVDITDRAKWSYAVHPDMTYTPSGVVDLSDFDSSNAPIFIAFKYNDVPSSVSQRAWNIKDLSVDIVLPGDGSLINLANSANMSWGTVNILNPARVWTFNTTEIIIWGGAAGMDENEDWIISKPIFLNRVQPDKGISIKNNPSALLTDYTFPGYGEPGSYNVTFEIINANRWDVKRTLKEFTITVQ